VREKTKIFKSGEGLMAKQILRLRVVLNDILPSIWGYTINEKRLKTAQYKYQERQKSLKEIKWSLSLFNRSKRR